MLTSISVYHVETHIYYPNPEGSSSWMWSSSSTFAWQGSYFDSTLSFVYNSLFFRFQRRKYKKYFEQSITFLDLFALKEQMKYKLSLIVH